MSTQEGYDERLAIRNAATLANAQEAYDNQAEPEGDFDADTLREMIRIAEELIGSAERCIAKGDLDAAADYMKSAAAELRGE